MRARDVIAFLLLIVIAGVSYFRDRAKPEAPFQPPGQQQEAPRRPSPEKFRDAPAEVPAGAPWEVETRAWLTDRPARQTTEASENFMLGRGGDIVLDEKRRSGSGTAFAVGDGVWLTARHVIDGCDDIGIQTGTKRAVKVSNATTHPNADVAILKTRQTPPALSIAPATGGDVRNAFMVGFPAGKPGAVSATQIGQSTLRERGRYRTAEPVRVWSERDRIPDRAGSLGGLSGGAVFDRDGTVIGVVLAEERRRGRIITALPATLYETAREAGATIGGGGKGGTFSEKDYPLTARELITSLRVARAICRVR